MCVKIINLICAAAQAQYDADSFIDFSICNLIFSAAQAQDCSPATCGADIFGSCICVTFCAGQEVECTAGGEACGEGSICCCRL